jgi:hypothetical protein
MRVPTSAILVTALGATQLGATDCGNVLKDPGFDLWCDGRLCAWTVERGSAVQVPTWNAADSGVELVGTDVAIAQLSPVAWTDGSCIEFDMIADVDESAEVDLNFDAYGDGTIDYTQRVPTSSWQPVSFVVSIGGHWAGMRFELAKRGTGRAVLAKIAAKVVDDATCAGFATSFTPTNAPLGGTCGGGTTCGSGGTCSVVGFGDQVCTGCDGTDASCGSGDVCGLGAPVSPVVGIPLACVSARSHALGEPCAAAGECATGFCTAGTCSTCTTDADCGSDARCGAGWPSTTDHAPYVCAPGGHQRASGEPCAADGDCASGRCDGSLRMECSADGRACTSPADCPFADSSLDSNALDNGPCITAGVQGGTCS